MPETLGKHCCQLSGRIQLITCHSRSATTSIRHKGRFLPPLNQNLTLEIRAERGKSKQTFRRASGVKKSWIPVKELFKIPRSAGDTSSGVFKATKALPMSSPQLEGFFLSFNNHINSSVRQDTANIFLESKVLLYTHLCPSLLLHPPCWSPWQRSYFSKKRSPESHTSCKLLNLQAF